MRDACRIKLYVRWTERSMPWVHFVPVKMDYSDLYDSLVFFNGLSDSPPGHDNLAERIASAGRDWVANFWRQEVPRVWKFNLHWRLIQCLIQDLTAYTWRMYLEWARLTNDNRTGLYFDMP
jgi:hypothetical protein